MMPFPCSKPFLETILGSGILHSLYEIKDNAFRERQLARQARIDVFKDMQARMAEKGMQFAESTLEQKFFGKSGEWCIKKIWNRLQNVGCRLPFACASLLADVRVSPSLLL